MLALLRVDTALLLGRLGQLAGTADIAAAAGRAVHHLDPHLLAGGVMDVPEHGHAPSPLPGATGAIGALPPGIGVARGGFRKTVVRLRWLLASP